MTCEYKQSEDKVSQCWEYSDKSAVRDLVVIKDGLVLYSTVKSIRALTKDGELTLLPKYLRGVPLKSPYGLAAGDGIFVVTDYGFVSTRSTWCYRVVRKQLDGHWMGSVVHLAGRPGRVVVNDIFEVVLLVERHEKCFLQKYTPSGEMLWSNYTGYVSLSSTYLTIDAKGRIILSARWGRKLYVYNQAGDLLSTLPPSNSSIEWPTGVCGPSAGSLIIAEWYRRRIGLYDGSGVQQTILEVTEGKPESLSLYEDQYLVVYMEWPQKIVCYDVSKVLPKPEEKSNEEDKYMYNVPRKDTLVSSRTQSIWV